jgi:hypothetical protein
VAHFIVCDDMQLQFPQFLEIRRILSLCAEGVQLCSVGRDSDAMQTQINVLLCKVHTAANNGSFAYILEQK